jgi:DNA polymerase-1
MTKRRTAIIDADSVLYSIAAMAEVRVDENEWLPLIPPEKALDQVVFMIESLTNEAGCDRALVVLSDHRNFRKVLYPAYKSNRKDARRPTILGELRALVMGADKGYGKLIIPWLEADDVCGISYGLLAEKGMESVIVSQDKDMCSIPCLLYNPRPNAFTGSRRPVETISEASADRFHLMQTLSGDAVDGYPGCPGIGFVKANKILEGYNNAEAVDAGVTGAEAWKRVVAAYVEKGLTEQDALLQARVARILRSKDWDAVNKKVKQWEPERD